MWRNDKRKIIILAYCDRFVFPLLSLFIPLFVGGNDRDTVFGLGVSLFCLSIYNAIGVRLKWKHMYCALQSLSHQKMTPEDVHWDTFSFADKYGVSMVFLAISTVALVCYFANIV